MCVCFNERKRERKKGEIEERERESDEVEGRKKERKRRGGVYVVRERLLVSLFGHTFLIPEIKIFSFVYHDFDSKFYSSFI